MRTIRLPDVPQRRLRFGSSEWAADSCLAAWSQFEREWLPPQPTRPGSSRREVPLSPFAAACAGVAFGGLGVAVWGALRLFWLG